LTQGTFAPVSVLSAEGRIVAGFPVAEPNLKIVAKKFKDQISMTQKDKPVIIQPTSEPCFDFTTDGYNRLKKTVIIAPIGIIEYDNNKFKVTYGCSRGNFCKDKECMYVESSEIEGNESSLNGDETYYSNLNG